MKKIICLILCVLIVATAIPFSVFNIASMPEITVEKFAENVMEMQKENKSLPASSRIIVKSKHKIDKLNSIAYAEGYEDLHILQFDSVENAQKAIEYYSDKEYIKYAQADTEITADNTTAANEEDMTSSSLSFGSHLSWGSETIGTDDYLDYISNVTSLPEITVGIIDTGIDIDHEFLKDRIIRTNFNISSTGDENSEEDDKGHGTHVAGIIADNTNDNVKLRAYKCLNSSGTGAISNAVISIYAAIEDGVNIINMSMSAKGTNDAMTEAVQSAVNSNICVCVSAGNNGKDASNYIPSSISECITVAAFDSRGSFPYWSNYGQGVDIAAPGVSINSSYKDGTYKSSSGTSMAAPFVSAGCALLLSKDSTLSPQKVCSVLRENGKKTIYNDSVKWAGVPALYLGNIAEFDKERTATPKFSISGGRYSDKLTTRIECSDSNAKIYYTTDGTRASEANGTLYTAPISVDSSMRIQAVAYSEGKIKSLQAFEEYYIVSTEPESNFEISTDGIITAYTGSSLYMTIPDTIKGITVTGLGDDLFKFTDMEIVILPDTVTSIGLNCFRGCEKLKAIDFSGCVSLGNNAFRGCISLSEINTNNISSIGEYAFYNCTSLLEFVNDKITTVTRFAFAHCTNMIYANIPNVSSIEFSGFFNCSAMKSVDASKLTRLGARGFSGLLQVMEFYIPSLTTLEVYNGRGENFASCERLDSISLPLYRGDIPVQCFNGCKSLKYAYVPNAVSFNTDSLKSCKSLEAIYAPELQNLSTVVASNFTLFTNNKLTSVNVTDGYSYKICAPSLSSSQTVANDNGCVFINSDCCSFTSTQNCEVTYICSESEETFSVPNEMLKHIWRDIMPINKPNDYIMHGFLINTVKDNTINAKDYALITMQ